MKTQDDKTGTRPDERAVKRAERAFRRGISTIQRRVTLRGVGAFSTRTAVGRALTSWREDLLRDCGGKDQLSAQRLTLIDLAVRTKLVLDHIDSFLLQQESLVNKSKRMAYPIVAQRQALVDSLARLLGQLGLDRVAKQIPTLEAYVASKDKSS